MYTCRQDTKNERQCCYVRRVTLELFFGWKQSDVTLLFICVFSQLHGQLRSSYLELARTVHTRNFWQGIHQIHGHTQCINTTLANPKHFQDAIHATLQHPTRCRVQCAIHKLQKKVTSLTTRCLLFLFLLSISTALFPWSSQLLSLLRLR
jgi:hypothetical protein